MIFAGSGSPNAENYLYNCVRNAACQAAFFIPVKDFSDIMLYFDLPSGASSASIQIVNCDGSTASGSICNNVFGQKPDGTFYGVVRLQGGGESGFTQFYIKATVGGYTYFSNHFEIDPCINLTKIEACYPAPLPNTFPTSQDCNGVYYGYPFAGGSGNTSFRYIHWLYVKNARVLGSKRKINFTFFNNKNPYNSVISKEYVLSFQPVPEFYADEIVGVIGRGQVTINGITYTVQDGQNFGVSDEDSGLWRTDIVLFEECKQYFNCSTDPCVIPDCGSGSGGGGGGGGGGNNCCTPTVISASAEAGDIFG